MSTSVKYKIRLYSVVLISSVAYTRQFFLFTTSKKSFTALNIGIFQNCLNKIRHLAQVRQIKVFYTYLGFYCFECYYYNCFYTECQYAECHYAESYCAECHCTECHYAKCNYVVNVVMLSVIMLIAIMLNVIKLGVTLLNVMMPVTNT